MQMYVNYFDRFQRAEHEAKTIGIVLCSEKNDAMVQDHAPRGQRADPRRALPDVPADRGGAARRAGARARGSRARAAARHGDGAMRKRPIPTSAEVRERVRKMVAAEGAGEAS